MPILQSNHRHAALEADTDLDNWSLLQTTEERSSRWSLLANEGTLRKQFKQVQWSVCATKRIVDIALASAALAGLSPVMVATAAAIKLSSQGPVLFRQTRMGQGGKPFTILKFRTMHPAGMGVPGPCVTKKGDKRLTPIGQFLRRTKLDEFPQLINVLRGDMSLVGPRPKVLQHQKNIMPYRPGITGAASLAFRNEEQALVGIPDDCLDDYQVHVLMPVKTALDTQYMESATLLSDFTLMARTVFGHPKDTDQSSMFKSQHSLLLLQAALLNKDKDPHPGSTISGRCYAEAKT